MCEQCWVEKRKITRNRLTFFQALGPILIYRYVEILNFMSAHLVMSLRMQEPLALVNGGFAYLSHVSAAEVVKFSVQYTLKVLDEQADDFSNELQGEDFAWMVPHVHSVCTLAARSPEDSISNFRNH